HSSSESSCRSGSGLAQPRAALEVDDPPAHPSVFCIDYVLPLESVVAGHVGVATCPAKECTRDTVTASDRLALQLAVNHVAALVGPDAASLHACAAIGEPYRTRSETDRRPLRPGEKQRP